MRTWLQFRAGITGGATDAELTSAFESVTERLLALEHDDPALSDATVSLDLDDHHVEIEVLVEAPTVDDAAAHGERYIRQAVAAVGRFGISGLRVEHSLAAVDDRS